MADRGIALPNFRPWVLLLVDDEPDVLRSLQGLIEATLPGVKVLVASSGRIGLEILDRERVDLIISDFKMPGMDGIEFLYQAHRVNSNIPRVMLTAFGSEDLARRAVFESFCTAVISKGSEPASLLQNVSTLLSYSPSAQAPPDSVPPAVKTGGPQSEGLGPKGS